MGTFILIVIGCIVIYILLASFSRANKRMYYADKQASLRQISEGSGRLPSWVHTSETDIFINAIHQLLIRNGIPSNKSKLLLANENTQLLILYVAGNMEEKGASFVQQEIAAMELVLDIWHSDNRSRLFE
ncbi:hypothetical protein [Ignatzschineria sp. LJL83]